MFVCGGHNSSRLLSFGEFRLVFSVRLIYKVGEVVFLSDICIKRVLPAILQRVVPSPSKRKKATRNDCSKKPRK